MAASTAAATARAEAEPSRRTASIGLPDRPDRRGVELAHPVGRGGQVTLRGGEASLLPGDDPLGVEQVTGQHVQVGRDVGRDHRHRRPAGAAETGQRLLGRRPVTLRLLGQSLGPPTVGLARRGLEQQRPDLRPLREQRLVDLEGDELGVHRRRLLRQPDQRGLQHVTGLHGEGHLLALGRGQGRAGRRERGQIGVEPGHLAGRGDRPAAGGEALLLGPQRHQSGAEVLQVGLGPVVGVPGGGDGAGEVGGLLGAGHRLGVGLAAGADHDALRPAVRLPQGRGLLAHLAPAGR